MKGLLALITYFVPDFANDGLYTLLYTVADGFFYFLPSPWRSVPRASSA